MFEGQIDFTKRLNILYDDVERQYRVIAKLTGVMARKYVCKGCNKHVQVTSRTSATRRVATAGPAPPTPCAFSNFRIPCLECNRHFRIHICYDNHKHSTTENRSVYERKRCCGTCRWLVTHGYHECKKRFCDIIKQNRDVDHLCYTRLLKDPLPSAM